MNSGKDQDGTTELLVTLRNYLTVLYACSFCSSCDYTCMSQGTFLGYMRIVFRRRVIPFVYFPSYGNFSVSHGWTLAIIKSLGWLLPFLCAGWWHLGVTQVIRKILRLKKFPEKKQSRKGHKNHKTPEKII